MSLPVASGVETWPQAARQEAAWKPADGPEPGVGFGAMDRKSVVPMVASRNTLTFTSKHREDQFEKGTFNYQLDFLLLGGSPIEAHFEIQDHLYVLVGYLVTCGDHCPRNFPQSFQNLAFFVDFIGFLGWGNEMTLKGALRKHPDQKVQCPRTEGKFKERQHVFAEGFLDVHKSFWRHGVLNFPGGSMANEHSKGRTFRRDLERFGMAPTSTHVLHVLYRKLPTFPIKAN